MTERTDFIRESIDFLHRYTMKSLQKQAEEHGVTVPQARVIAEVLSNKTISIKQLSQNLKMTQSTVSDIVERLTAKGILLKTPSAKDRRSVEITLTDETVKEINESIPDILNKSIRGVLDMLQPNEQEIVEEGMGLLVSAVKERMDAEGMDNLGAFNVLFFPEDKSQGK